VCGDSEGQPDIHAGVVLDGDIDELFEFGEGHDFLEFATEISRSGMPRMAPLKEHVFAVGEFGMEAGASTKLPTRPRISVQPEVGRACTSKERLLASRRFLALAATKKSPRKTQKPLHHMTQALVVLLELRATIFLAEPTRLDDDAHVPSAKHLSCQEGESVGA